jgi:hypothetical protein
MHSLNASDIFLYSKLHFCLNFANKGAGNRIVKVQSATVLFLFIQLYSIVATIFVKIPTTRENQMQIMASVGKAPKTASLKNQVYKLTLTAQTQGEMQWLAGLLPAVERAMPYTLKKAVPKLRIKPVPDIEAYTGDKFSI